MLDWLLRVLGLAPAQAPASARRMEPDSSAMFTPHAPPERDAYDIELLDPEPVRPPAFEPKPAPAHEAPAYEVPATEAPGHAAPAPDASAHGYDPKPASALAPAHEPERVAPAALQFAAFALQSSAGARVFARPDDAQLVHEPDQTGASGWEVHGFVTDSHPGLLFVLAAEGPTAIGPHGDRAVAHAFRIEESGDDAFALYDLSTEAYLCAPRFLPDVNPLENDRGMVNEWEMFHLIAVEGVTLPQALPSLLPPAGTPLTADILQSWRRPA